MSHKPRGRVQVEFPEPSLTIQEVGIDHDINAIMRRYEATGQLPDFPERVAQYGDFSEVSDYHTALNRVREIDESFMKLPASVRAQFDNDPARYVDQVLYERDNPVPVVETPVTEEIAS